MKTTSKKTDGKNQVINDLLNKENISLFDLTSNNIILEDLDDNTINLIVSKLNKKEIQPKANKDVLSIYKEENNYLVENKLTNLKGTNKEINFKRLRQKSRNKLMTFATSKNVNKDVIKDFYNFLDVTYTKFNKVDYMSNFKQLDITKQLVIKDFFLRISKIK